jgi:cell division protein FtsB
MKPPQSRQRSLSVTRQSVKSSGPLSNPVTFKTQGEFFNMSKLVQETLLKPDLIKNIVPSLLNEIKAELISELKSAIRSTVAEAIEKVVNPLRQLINEHQNKIKSLENENNQLKEHVKSSIASVEARYEKFRNVTNNTATFIADNKKLKADNLKLIDEVSQLNGNIEELIKSGGVIFSILLTMSTISWSVFWRSLAPSERYEIGAMFGVRIVPVPQYCRLVATLHR